MSCQCEHNQTCNHTSGACPYGRCLAGYEGEDCQSGVESMFEKAYILSSVVFTYLSQLCEQNMTYLKLSSVLSLLKLPLPKKPQPIKKERGHNAHNWQVISVPPKYFG